MHELITRITGAAGISTEQATKALESIKDFVKEKFPMMAGAVDNLFAGSEAETAPAAASAIIDPGAPEVKEPGMMDKISDVIPGQAGEKVEQFVKDAAEKAEDIFDNLKDKLTGFLGTDKK